VRGNKRWVKLSAWVVGYEMNELKLSISFPFCLVPDSLIRLFPVWIIVKE
jgi:hypothetical protein